MENLFLAWKEFCRGKRKKPDIQKFDLNLEDNIFRLHCELKNKLYKHSNYTTFYVQDPKLRVINKANVRDRLLHHAIFRVLCQIFDKKFIFDSYSCRAEKGTHSAVNRLDKFCRKLSGNNHRNIFALKCDIRKFFNSIDQGILLELIKNKISDANAIWLIEIIIRSFERGLPLGNVTSQLFANIYLNELDRFAKHNLKEKYYIRYCDDFIILGDKEDCFSEKILRIERFLNEKLKLKLHPDKIIIRSYRQGIDFLGYVIFPYKKILRTKTKKRILIKIKNKRQDFKNGIILKNLFLQSLYSYLGVLKHCNGYKIIKNIKTICLKR